MSCAVDDQRDSEPRPRGVCLTLTELDLGGSVWVAWVRKLSLQRYVAQTALSPDRHLLVSVKGLAKRWECSDKYVYRLVKDGKLELTVVVDTYGQKVGVGVTYREVLAYEKAQTKASRGKLKNFAVGLTVEP